MPAGGDRIRLPGIISHRDADREGELRNDGARLIEIAGVGVGRAIHCWKFFLNYLLELFKILWRHVRVAELWIDLDGSGIGLAVGARVEDGRRADLGILGIEGPRFEASGLEYLELLLICVLEPILIIAAELHEREAILIWRPVKADAHVVDVAQRVLQLIQQAILLLLQVRRIRLYAHVARDTVSEVDLDRVGLRHLINNEARCIFQSGLAIVLLEGEGILILHPLSIHQEVRIQRVMIREAGWLEEKRAGDSMAVCDCIVDQSFC